MATWAIRNGYKYQPVEVIRETDATVFYLETRWSGGDQETRGQKHKFLDWRGSEQAALILVEKLNSADAERDRRLNAARDWHRKRVKDLTRDSDGSPKGEDA